MVCGNAEAGLVPGLPMPHPVDASSGQASATTAE